MQEYDAKEKPTSSTDYARSVKEYRGKDKGEYEVYQPTPEERIGCPILDHSFRFSRPSSDIHQKNYRIAKDKTKTSQDYYFQRVSSALLVDFSLFLSSQNEQPTVRLSAANRRQTSQDIIKLQGFRTYYSEHITDLK